jgi:hypothetical protein
VSGFRIQNDDQYDKALEWLRERAEKIQLKVHDPLTSDEDRASLLKNYDLVSDEIQRYRREGPAKPSIPEADPEPPKQLDPPPAPPPAPPPDPQPAKKVRDFLDDDE